jgi:ankyrin repeat protein
MSPKAIRKALVDLPSGSDSKAYDNAYVNAMERIESQLEDQVQLAKQVLSWVTCAERPLSTDELQVALGIEPGHSTLDRDNLPEIEDMISVCAGLVTIDEKSKVFRLVHYTTQDFFDRTQSKWFPSAEADIARNCLTYLSFQNFKTGLCSTDKDLDKRLQLNPLYVYAANNWGYHASRASDVREEIVDFFTLQAHMEAAFQAMTVFRLQEYFGIPLEQSKGITGLHLVASFGMEGLAKSMLCQEHADVNVCNSAGQTPLLFSAASGQEALSSLLLENGADLDPREQQQYSPIFYAILGGSKEVVRMLLDGGVDIHVKGASGVTPLYLGIASGEQAIVRLLLDKGADIETLSSRGQTPLFQATATKDIGMVRLLFEYGADINKKNRGGWTPLFQAVANNDCDTARVLLELGADVNLPNNQGWTPLFQATSTSDHDTVKLLIEHGADVYARTNDWSSIHLASLLKNDEILNLMQKALTHGDDDKRRVIAGL